MGRGGAMLIVAFGDIHGHIDYIDKIKEINQADWVIISGDLSNFGGEGVAKEVINRVKKYNKNILAQIGNMDTIEMDKYFTKLNINLHGHGYRLNNDVAVFGVGGSNPTPFHTPTEYSEEELASFLFSAYEEIKDVPYKILVSHTPPYGTKVDIVGRGEHVGSHTIRKFIERYQPALCITGHIHEARNIDKIGNTVIINPGTINQGYVLVKWVEKQLKAELAKY